MNTRSPTRSRVQLDLERLRGHEPAGAHDQLGAARLVVVQMRGDLVVDHAALPAANRRHVDLDSPRLRAVLGAVANQRCDLGALDLVLAGQAVDVGTGATNPSSFHDGRPSPRSRHVPRQELATRATAKNQDFNSFRLRHGFLRGDMVSFAILGRYSTEVPLFLAPLQVPESKEQHKIRVRHHASRPAK